MRTQIKFQFAFWATMLCAYSLQAQQSTTAAGGEASSTNGTVSFSVGQVNYEAFENQDGISVSAGVQQSYQVFTGNDEITSGLNVNLVVFPNPTRDLITLRIDELPNETLYYHLFDNTGKTLLTRQITSTDSFIDMARWPVATYHLRVMSKDALVKSFKIVKT